MRWVQAQTALALGVALDQEGVCTAAGGWYIQVLPLVSDETLECLERNIAALPSTTDLLSQGVTPEQLTGTHLPPRSLGLAAGVDDKVGRVDGGGGVCSDGAMHAVQSGCWRAWGARPARSSRHRSTGRVGWTCCARACSRRWRPSHPARSRRPSVMCVLVPLALQPLPLPALLSFVRCCALCSTQRGGSSTQVGNIEVKCEFCQTQVHFSREDLAQLLV